MALHLTGEFDYFDCWRAFLTPGTNEEKLNTAATFRALAIELKKRNIVFTGDNPVNLFEPGIGDGSSTKRFVEAIANIHMPGFLINGADTDKEQLDLASNTLSSLFSNQAQLNTLIHADVFKDQIDFTAQVDIIFGSHFLYFIKHKHEGSPHADARVNQDLGTFVTNMRNNLHNNGIMLLYHDGENSEIYGSDGIGGVFGHSMTDAPERIQRAVEDEGLYVCNLDVPSRLYFPALPWSQVQCLQTLNGWQDLEEGILLEEWAKKVLFSLDIFPVFKGEEVVSNGGVKALADEGRLKDAIEWIYQFTQRDDGCYITMCATMQAVFSNQAMAAPIKDAFDSVERQMPDIRANTKAALIMEGQDYQYKKILNYQAP